MAYIAQSMFSNSAKKDLQKFQYCFCKKKKLSVQRERVKKSYRGKFKALLQRLSIVTGSVKEMEKQSYKQNN